MPRLTTTSLDVHKKTRQLWPVKPATRVQEGSPKKNVKKERQKSKLLLKKAHDDAPFEF